MKNMKHKKQAMRFMSFITCVCLITETLFSYNSLTAHAASSQQPPSTEVTSTSELPSSNDTNTISTASSSDIEASSSNMISTDDATMSTNEASSNDSSNSEDSTSSMDATTSTDSTTTATVTESNVTPSSTDTSSTITYIDINKSNFPDEQFLDYICANFDINADKKLSNEELSSVTKIDVSNLTISSLKGIELFTNLTDLNCTNNRLTALTIDSLTKLSTLKCSWNQLTSLDVTNNPDLTNLECIANVRAILINENNQFDLHALTDFNIEQTKNWSCSYVKEDNLLTFDTALSSSTVTYESTISNINFKDEVLNYTLVLSKDAFESIEINEANFPDVSFNQFVRTSFDKDKNNILDNEELITITNMDISNLTITDLTGIQLFKNLTYFNYSSAQNPNLNTNMLPSTTILYCDNALFTQQADSTLENSTSENSNTDNSTTENSTNENNTVDINTTVNTTTDNSTTEINATENHITDNTTSESTTDTSIASETVIPAPIANTDLPATTTTISYTISFDTMGGTAINSIVFTANTPVDSSSLPSNPTKAGFTFDGWYYDNIFTNKFTSISPGLTQNITLYAKWNQLFVNPTKITSAKNSGKGKLSIAYNEIAGVAGYEVLCSTSKKFNSNIRTTTSTSTKLTVKGLIKNKTYYVKVRGYVIDSTDNKVYSNYSSVKKVKVKSGVSEVAATSTSASISSCKITDSNTVTIKVKAKNVVKSSDSYYYLFSVPSTKSNLKKLKPIANSEKSTSFTFRTNLDKDGANSLLNSKFVIAIKQKSSYKIISAFHYITNPEAVAEYSYAFPTAPTKKGLQGFSSSLGVNHTVINIEVNDLIATPSEYGSKSTIEYTYKGKTYYFRKDAVKSYAATAKYFSDKGAIVYAILLMSWSSKTELITPKGRRYGYPYYAWNTKDQKVKEQLEATITYFAEYCCSICKDGPGIAGWIVGNEVDNFDTWNYAGTSNFDTYAKIYADTFRLVYNATKSVYSNARVYISLDHMWAMSNEGSFGSKAFLEKFNSILASEGNIDWDIAYHPYPVPLTEPDFWKNDFISNNENSDIVNMKNLSVLTNYVKKHYGKDKRIILSEVGFTSTSGEKLQAAAIAYAYYIAEFNPMVDAFIMRSLADADVEVEQGLAFGIVGKKAYDVYKYMDTPKSESYTKFALKVIGTKKWKSIVPKYNAKKFRTMPNR